MARAAIERLSDFVVRRIRRPCRKGRGTSEGIERDDNVFGRQERRSRDWS